jgi:hypothetical protein
MTTSVIDAATLLAIDVGTIHTRAFLFDVADGSYRFLAAGVAPTSIGSPYNDIGEGVHLAIDRLQEITGRVFIGTNGHLIVPTQPDGSGIDAMVGTISACPSIQPVVVGLLTDVSLESAQRLAATAYCKIVDTIGLNDRRKTEVQIDSIIRLQPDLVIMAGGTDNGASRSVGKLLEVVGLAAYLLPGEKRPSILYAGNKNLVDKVKQRLEPLTVLRTAANIRPTFALEDLDPAQEALGQLTMQILTRRTTGMQAFSSLMGERLMLSAQAFGRMIRFLSRIYSPGKGVLGIDLGAGSTTIAVGNAGRLILNTNHGLGMGQGINALLGQLSLPELSQWFPLHIPDDYARDYLYNKSINPGSVPVTVDDLAIEQAAARQVLRLALRRTVQRYPAFNYSPGFGLAAPFEPILAAGSIFTQAPTPGQVLMMLLDALQPVGITTFVIDQNNLLTSLGAIAGVNPLLPVQVLESGAFLNLGTVISPVSQMKYGTPILRIRLVTANGDESRYEARQGMLAVLPVPTGQKARLHLEPLHRADVGMGRPGKGGNLNVVGGALGVVIDARGRPLLLPKDAARRREMIKKWLWRLGG